ncbi:hypothetical protein F5883DRAFT_668311 [Diaporthe sp. PMI_573]|nr:hypothetical protein F5883DRAFT_668311 [Diaporthaceae sp. PMI_573]
MFLSMFASNRHSQLKYESLSTTPTEVDGNASKSRDRSSLTQYFFVAVVLCSVLQIALILHAISLLRSRPAYTDTPPDLAGHVSNCSCGATIQEARALNCAFDVLSLSWLPPTCRDDALTHEFATSGPGPDGEWDYWADANRTSPLTLEEVASLAGRSDGLVYTTLGFHVQHCSYYWRKYWRVVKGVGALAMEARYDQESHVEHCQHVFMSEGSRDLGTTEGFVRLGGEFF